MSQVPGASDKIALSPSGSGSIDAWPRRIRTVTISAMSEAAFISNTSQNRNSSLSTASDPEGRGAPEVKDVLLWSMQTVMGFVWFTSCCSVHSSKSSNEGEKNQLQTVARGKGENEINKYTRRACL
jgi:hypothetical protein